MGGDIGEIKLGSERELYKYINHYVAVKRGKKKIYIYILVQVNIIFALPDYSSGVIVLFLIFSVLVANPKKLLYTVANPARGLLNREKRTKEKVWQHTPLPPTLLVRRK